MDPAVRHVVIVGSTAAGKSRFALALARRHPELEIISADAMAVYRGMDIGTAKPSRLERAEVPHHLIDVADPSEDYSVARFQTDVVEARRGIEARGHTAVLVGGTGLYVTAAVDGLTVPGRFPEVVAALEAEPDTAALYARLRALDPVAAARILAGNRRRIVRALEVSVGSGQPFSSFGPGVSAFPPTRFRLIGLAVSPDELARRIEARFATMLAAGLVDEVRTLAGRPEGWSRTARQAVGYRQLLAHVEDGQSLVDAAADAVVATRRLARRQRAWYRRDPRVRWLDGERNPLALVDDLDADWDRWLLSS